MIARRLLPALAAIASLGLFPPSVGPAQATKPIKKDKFVYDAASGYILVRMGPKPKVFKYLYFARMDAVNPNRTLWTYGDGNPYSDKTHDVALANYGANWLDEGDNAWVLMRVNPGRWVIAGVDDAGLTTSLSLGSYGFDVKPGEITYIGTVRFGPENGKSGVPEIDRQRLSDDLVNYGTLMNLVMSYSIAFAPAQPTDKPPPELTQYKIVSPEIVSDVRFNNLTRGLISRAATLPPLEHMKPQ